MKNLIILVVIFLHTGCSTIKEWHHLPESAEDEKTLFVVNHGWHTGVVVSDENLGTELSFLRTYFSEGDFFELSWGDRAFYQAKEMTAGITVRAIFWPTPSVMHVVALPKEPNLYFAGSETIAVTISSKGHRLLNEVIANSFKRNEKNEVIRTQEGIYGHSLFFEGTGRYYITKTCNTWTARALEEAGVPIRTFMTLTTSNVMSQLQKAVAKYECCP